MWLSDIVATKANEEEQRELGKGLLEIEQLTEKLEVARAQQGRQLATAFDQIKTNAAI